MTSSAIVFATPWYELYRNSEILNDSKLWEKEIVPLMEQFKSNITDTSYQSEVGSISSGLSRIENPEVVDTIWKFYKVNNNAELNDVSIKSILAVAQNNKKMQDYVFQEFSLLKDPKLKHRFSFSICRWDNPPIEAVKYMFEGLADLPLKDRVQSLNRFGNMLARMEKDNPPKHLREYLLGIQNRILLASDQAEVKELSSIVAQFAKWESDSYVNILKMYKDGKLDDKKFVTILNSISHEVNATIGATFRNLPATSIDSVFEIARAAKADSSPLVRSAVAEFVIRQAYGEHLPMDLLAWVNNELVADIEAQKQIQKMYNEFGDQSKKSLHDKFPNLFESPSRFSFKKLLRTCLRSQL